MKFICDGFSALVLMVLLLGCNAMERPDPVLSDQQVFELEERFLAHSFPTAYSDSRAIQDVLRDFRIPGAGMSVLGKLTNSNLESYCIYELSIPGRNRDLVIVFQYDAPPAESYRFVHRFIIDTYVEDELLRPRREVKLDDGFLRYYSNGREYKSEELPART